MGLRGAQGAPLDAKICPEGPKTSPTPTPSQIWQDQPHPHMKKKYGAKEQFTKPLDHDTPTLDKAGKKFIQEVTGDFLFLAGAINGTMLTPLSALASEQSAPTEATMEKCLQFLDYPGSQEDAILNYKASDMVLAIHSNASYLSKPKAPSRAGGHMFMAGKEEILINNGAVLNISQIIKAVMSSAAEAELAALFINAKASGSMRQMLKELGHPQTQTPMQTSNSTAHALLTIKSSQRRSKPWICNSIGYNAVKHRANIGIIGDLEPKT
jgi:hypothetical protein